MFFYISFTNPWHVLHICKLYPFLFPEKLTGMNEHSGSIVTSSSAQAIGQAVNEVANVIQVASSSPDTYLYAAKTVMSETDTLVSIQLSPDKANVTVNCEKMVIGSMLLKNIKTAISKL